jgi:hypothetical protein
MSKKLLIALSIALLTVASASAQGVTYGAKVLVGMSSLSGADADNAESMLSYAAGGFANIDLAMVGIQPEVLYSSKGAAVKDTDFKVALTYIDIPVLVTYSVIPTLKVLAGPTVGILLSSEYTDGDNSMDIKDETNGLDMGLAVGAAFVPMDKIHVDLRYNMGLSKLDKEGDVDTKNSGFALGVGYAF